ncbi:hypothetical protein P154DRAFT_569865 [Amniculicola lignicola CBS 123094]|uniref:Uncharacterized protein n=1 Tax=Amniculicola lignicola CBS 123094 TaxID=1392246 RepID=A0A6A5X155_9PLEO|nr:hypothetical protein P154DRAFT_569865 [Amniculicola lignicola CBS 123094]
MISPTESFVGDLAARATVETYGNIGIIAVPGVETLTKSQRIAVVKKAQQQLIADHLDADALRLRLQAITPPPDEEEDEEESRKLEAQARHDLESDGCPPCYPLCLDVPVRNPPEKYRQIIEYWESFSATDDVVLCAQRSDWQKFRQSQQRLRQRYRNKSFRVFLDEVRKRRRAHGLDADVYLLSDPQRQSRQQTWIEFQDYHLKLHERQRKKRDGLQKDLDNTRKEASGTDMKGSEHPVQQERAIHQRLEYAETTLRWHEVMLCWIEQCRLAMDPLPPTPAKKGSGGQNALSDRQRRSRRLAVLGNVRVSKSTPNCQNIRTRTSKATISEHISSDSAITIGSSTQQQIPKCQEIKPRRPKDKAMGKPFLKRGGQGKLG